MEFDFSEKTNKAAYKKANRDNDVEDLTTDEIANILVTCDGMGSEFKIKALKEFQKRCAGV